VICRTQDASLDDETTHYTQTPSTTVGIIYRSAIYKKVAFEKYRMSTDSTAPNAMSRSSYDTHLAHLVTLQFHKCTELPPDFEQSQRRMANRSLAI
jgi:hypothetical protein